MTTMPPGGRTALNVAIDHESGVVKTTPRLRAELEKLGYIARDGRAWKVTPEGVEAVRPSAPHQPGARVTTPDGPGTVRSVDQFASGTRYEVALDTPLPGQRAVQRYTPNQLAAEPSQPLARATCTSTWTRYGETHECARPAGHPEGYHRSGDEAYWLDEAATPAPVAARDHLNAWICHAHGDANNKVAASLADLQQLVAAMRADTVDCADIEAVARRLTHLGDQIGRRAALVDLIRSDQ